MRNTTVAIDDQIYSKIRAWCAPRAIFDSLVVRIFLNVFPRIEQCSLFSLLEAPHANSLGAMLDLNPFDHKLPRHEMSAPPGLLCEVKL